MNRRNPYGGLWVLFIFMLFFGAGSWLPLLLITGAAVFFMVKAIKASKEQASFGAGESSGTGYTYGHATRTSDDPGPSSQDMTMIDAYLRRYFSNKRLMEMNDSLDLVLHGAGYDGMDNLDVYRSGKRIGRMDHFRRHYPDAYRSLLSTLLTMAKQDRSHGTVVDAEVVQPGEQEEEEAPAEEAAAAPAAEEAPKTKNAQYFIDTINGLNDDIPDEEISNGLYQSTALLKQIAQYEAKFPESHTKLARLYSYYLPILVRILQQYSNLQFAKSDPSYASTQENLKRTLKLVNEAMQKIISGMTDNDFINLSADMSTLEAVLKKDGMAGDDPLGSLSADPQQTKEEGKSA